MACPPKTYYRPEHGWTCFHCGETFTSVGSARDHFGATPEAEPGCMIRVQYGEERGLLMALREAEQELARLRSEDRDAEQFYRLNAEHTRALREAEERGYERGLRDGRAEASTEPPP